MRQSCILELARRRKTARRFSQIPPNLEEVLVALEAACQAPSGANSQPWRFVVITDPHVKAKIRDACEEGEKGFYSTVSGEFREWLVERGFSWKKPFLEEAPLLILVLSQTCKPYSKESVWLAIGYILLALEEHGLNTVTYTPTVTEGVLKVMGVPEGFRLEAILPVGVSVDEKTKEPRFNLDEVAYLNAWGRHIEPATEP